ncbi:replication factor C subunit 3-like [Rhododendron vialii]|uniref:replication factor C subunit 3-like n=1 Tax=Rhododendron vialii TaxID=182163 RepID=UPI00265F03B0|nr:replication factor C subunit 3-like [Rhododendron vialii]
MGKTMLAVARKLYGMQMHNMVLELNASDECGIDIVRQQIHDFASTQIFSFGSKTKAERQCYHPCGGSETITKTPPQPQDCKMLAMAQNHHNSQDWKHN